MLTEVEAKSRTLENLAVLCAAFRLPLTVTKLRYTNVDIDGVWSQLMDSFVESAADRAGEGGERLVKALEAGMVRRLLRTLFDFYPLVESFDYPPRGTGKHQSPAVRLLLNFVSS